VQEPVVAVKAALSPSEEVIGYPKSPACLFPIGVGIETCLAFGGRKAP
jgi:hypothetical protein